MRGVIHIYHPDGEDVVALRGVDMDVEAGETVALLGPSGMGKSTVLRLLAGVMRPSAGTILIGQLNLAELATHELQAMRADKLSYVLQDTGANLLPYATGRENVWFAQQAARGRGRQLHFEPDEILHALGLEVRSNQRVADLPRGAQQLVALASAVGTSPQLLLADEPTSQLDSHATGAVIELLQRINEAFGTTVIIVTHDSSVAGTFGRAVTIRDGRVGSEGVRGREYAVVDQSGSLQLPSEVLQILAPGTRVEVVRREDGVQLRPMEPEA
jgi:ABC-type lipoprotein export system ATPase subunit